MLARSILRSALVAIGTERAARIANGKSQHQPAQAIHPAAHDSSMRAASPRSHRPRNSASRSRRRPFPSRDQLRKMARIVTPIGVHRDEHVVRLFKGPLHSRYRRGAEALFAGAMKAVQTRFGRGALVAPAARAVGRVVVDDENVCGGQYAKYFVDETRQIFNLVVRGQDDKRVRIDGDTELCSP